MMIADAAKRTVPIDLGDKSVEANLTPRSWGELFPSSQHLPCFPLGWETASTASIVGNIAAPASWKGFMVSVICLAEEMCIINSL